MYPGEEEMLFAPLSSLEHVGDPRLEPYGSEQAPPLSFVPPAHAFLRSLARLEQIEHRAGNGTKMEES